MKGKHQEFADAYLADAELNATRAYLKVYPRSSEAAARRSASDLLTRPDIQAYVAERMKQRAQRTEITQDFVLQGLKQVALRCLQRIPVMRYDREEKRMVQVTEEVVDPRTGETREEGVWQFDSGGANRSLELLGKHLGVFTEAPEGAEVPLPTKVEIVVRDARRPA